MTRAEEFEEFEEAVQETWLRYQSSPATPASAKAFLSAVVTRISIDVLRSARVRREEYAGPWLPEPLLTDPYQRTRLAGPRIDRKGRPRRPLADEAAHLLRQAGAPRCRHILVDEAQDPRPV